VAPHGSITPQVLKTRKMNTDYTIHPDPKCVRAQEDFLANCDPQQRRFHELLFKFGNVSFRYHLAAKEFEPTLTDWNEWIDGLDEPMKSSFRKQGFDSCRGVLSFTRYVNEKNDIGMEEFVKLHLSADDYLEYRSLVNEKRSV
jgi:hypothetical protein